MRCVFVGLDNKIYSQSLAFFSHFTYTGYTETRYVMYGYGYFKVMFL